MPQVSVVSGATRSFEQAGVSSTIDVAVVSDPAVHRAVNMGRGSETQAISDLSRDGVVWWKVLANAAGLYTVVLVVVLLGLTLLPIIAGYRPTVVTSGSMSPALRPSDVVLLDSIDETAPVGAVIDYQTDTGNRIHRVVSVADEGYVTMGDANEVPDSGTVAEQDVNGIGVMAVPLIGLPSLWLHRGQSMRLAGLLAGLVLAGWVAPRSWLLRGEPRRF